MNLLDLMVKIGVDDQASGRIGEVGGGIKSALGGAAKVGAAAIGTAVAAAASGAAAIGKAAFDGYKDFEQLSGGISKLYGTAGQTLEEYAESVGQTVEEASAKYEQLSQAQELMMQKAQQGWRTAGMDANEYMETATSFSASLINSLGGDTVAAADMTDRAMQAISDNYNTFGGDMEGVKNAFMGFAKENYTMLDNLKLGYAGTKAGMEQLIADANEWGAANGEASDLTIDSFADVVTAIEQVQKKQGIYGTTSREALTTIEGSINATKAAWSNFLTELGKDDADIAARFDDLSQAAGAAVDNIVPRIATIAEKMSEALPAFIPRAIELGGQVVGAIGEGLVRAVPAVLASLGSSVGMILASVGERKAELVSRAAELFGGLRDGFEANVGGVVGQARELIEGVGGELEDGIPAMLDSLGGITEGLLDIVSELVPIATGLVGKLLETVGNAVVSGIPQLVEYGRTLFTSLIDAVGTVALQVLEQVGSLVSSLAGALMQEAPNIFDAALDMFNGVLDALVQNAPDIWDGFVSILSSLIDAIVQNAPAFLSAAVSFVLGLLQAIVTNAPAILAAIGSMLGELVTMLLGKVPDILAAGLELMAGLLEAVVSAAGDVVGAIDEVVQGALDAVGDFFGSMFEAGAGLVNNVINGVRSAVGGLVAAFSNAINSIRSAWSSLTSFVSGIPGRIVSFFQSVPGAITGFFSTMASNVRGKFDELVGFVSGVPGRIIGLFSGAGSWLVDSGRALINGFVDGITGAFRNAVTAVSDGLGSIRKLFPFSPAKEGPFSGRGWVLYSGMAIMDALADGARRKAGQTVSAFAGVAGMVRDALDVDAPLLSANYAKNAVTGPGIGANGVSQPLPSITMYLNYNAGEDATKLYYDFAEQLVLHGYGRGLGYVG